MKKIFFYISILTAFIFIYILISDKKSNKGFNTVLYTGEVKSNKKIVPSELNWFDSFKGIDNKGK